MKKKSIIINLIVIVILGLSALYLYFDNTKLQVSNYTIVNHNIPVDFNNYKIVQISDFHNTKSKNLNNDLVEEIKKQKPDIIVLTGDLIDSNKTDIDIAINLVKEINDIAPIYFVSGNHEASISDYSKLKDKLEENKVVILDNKIEVLRINESEINLIGIDDPRMAHESFVSDSEILNAELDNAKYVDDKYNILPEASSASANRCTPQSSRFGILLSHRPELFGTYVEKGIDLVLAGHAHGGQIRIPFIGGIVAPNQGFFPRYTSGIYDEKNTTMIVSRGIGNSIIPFRINNRPELVVVTLYSK